MNSGFRVAIVTGTEVPLAVFSSNSPLMAAAGIATFTSVALFEAGSTASSIPGKVMVVTSSILTPVNVITSPPRNPSAGVATTFSGSAMPMLAIATSTPEAGIITTAPSVAFSGNINVMVSSPPSDLSYANSTSSPFGIFTVFTKSRSLPFTTISSPGFFAVRSSGASTEGRIITIPSTCIRLRKASESSEEASAKVTSPVFASIGTFT